MHLIFRPFPKAAPFLLQTFFLMLLCSSCVSLSSQVKSEEKITQLEPNNAYIVIGQKISKGNLRRMSIALFANDKIVKSKGIQLPNSKFAGPQLGGRFHNIFIIADSENHAYTFWKIPIDLSSGTNCLLFLQSVSSEKAHFVPKVGPLSGYAFRTGTNFVPLEYGAYDVFWGSSFLAGKPGVYYLGEISISGYIGQEKEHRNWKGSYKTVDLNWTIDKSANLNKVKTFLSSIAEENYAFFDLSDTWKKIPMPVFD